MSDELSGLRALVGTLRDLTRCEPRNVSDVSPEQHSREIMANVCVVWQRNAELFPDRWQADYQDSHAVGKAPGDALLRLGRHLLLGTPGDATDTATERLRASCNWFWNTPSEYPDMTELRDATGRLLAFIDKRPGYCDRGHWRVQVDAVPDLDEQDAFPRYFMRLSTAKQELVEFLAWRLHKRRVVES